MASCSIITLWRLGIGELEPFLTPAIAARRGVFAHPVDKGPKLLARAEYGYQFNPYSYRAPFAAAAQAFQVEVVNADDLRCRMRRGHDFRAPPFQRPGDRSGSVCRLHRAGCATAFTRWASKPRSGGGCAPRSANVPPERIGPPCRSVIARDFGWQSETSLKASVARLTVYAPETESEALAAHGDSPQYTGEITLGRRASAWVGNCVAIGHAASVLEPLSHAPMLLLEREIDRLLTLVPFSHDMAVERREYNRQGAEDFTHAQIFNRALL